MDFTKKLFLAVLGMVIFASCSPNLTPFTQDLYEREKWSKEDLKKIQFYVSKDIVLYREFESGGSNITNGKIRIKNGRKIEEVVIRRGTPGVVIFIPKENRFAISFEAASDEQYLMFGPNPKLSDRYALLAKKWAKSGGTVNYAGQPFSVDTGSAFASLLVDMEQIGDSEIRRKVAKGRTVQ